MKNRILNYINKKYAINKKFNINIGDIVNIYINIIEKNKTRIQIFNGMIISIKGIGINSTFIVRRYSKGEIVEKIFFFNSPIINNINVIKQGSVNKSKLYWIRKSTNKKIKKIIKKQ